jgi:hypothetical protein
MPLAWQWARALRSICYDDFNNESPPQQFMTNSLTIHILPGLLAVCRLPADAPSPEWARSNELLAFIRTQDEFSIVCAQECIPENVTAERGWRVLKVAGPLDFSLVGVLASLALPLAEVGVSIFALSTYDTDYILVKEVDLDSACQALREAGHVVLRSHDG